MNVGSRLRPLIVAIALNLLLASQLCFSQDSDPDTEIYQRLQNALVQIPEIFEAGAHAAVRSGFRARLNDLHERMYELETAKRELLRMLKSTDRDLAELARENPKFARGLRDVHRLTVRCRDGIKDLGSHVRKLGSEAVASELVISAALESRQNWVEQIRTFRARKNDVVESGERAIEALQDADLELLKVMEALQRM